MDSERSVFVAVYGRRSVGKTYLIRSYFQDTFDFWFTGMFSESRDTQLKEFRNTLSAISGRNYQAFADWFEAFSALKEYLLSLNKPQVVVFLDELPWMDTPKSSFVSAFSLFWNMWPSLKVRLKLFCCGSATSWMLNTIIGDKGGLYGRVTRTIYISPFTLRETELFLSLIKGMTLSRREILDIYMILGGIPYYLDKLDRNLPVSVNIDNLFFSRNALLKSEYSFLFRSLFSDGNMYRKVVETLASKSSGMTRSEISSATGLSGGSLTKVLEELSACDFLTRYTAPGRKKKDMIFQLSDLFTLFSIRFVSGGDGLDESFWTKGMNSGSRNAWKGYAFEQVCLHHIKEIKARLGISGVLSNVYAWHQPAFTEEDGTEWQGGQIELIIDRKDDCINLCEIKYCNEEYVITSEYETRLRERTALFRHVTKTRKALHLTFITTSGVKRNTHYGVIQSEVKLDDLFREVYF